MIYMSAGVPAVCQRAGECARMIRDGVDGMLARTSEEWFDQLKALVISPRLRQKIGERALQLIRREHTIDQAFNVLQESLLGLIQPLEESSPGRVAKNYSGATL